MRAAIVVLVLALGGFTLARHAIADGPAGVRVGFDHARHEVALDKRGDAAAACTKCHAFARTGELVGKPGHAACFGACHGPPPKSTTGQPLAVADAAKRICVACHAEAKLYGPVPADRKWYAVDYAPYRVAPDFATSFGHQQHAATTCSTCHATPDSEPRSGAPHRRCASCHDGKGGTAAKPRGFAMTDCRGCHARSEGTGAGPVQLAPSEIVVDTAFSHGKHATRGAAKQCIACHGPIANSNDRALPRPSAGTCATAGCHDQKAAFGITAACTKCHQDVPRGIFVVARPTTRFSHALPAHAGAKLACTACHPIAASSNEILVGGHAPCVACHEQDFGERKPKICGACHNGTEPWRPLVADRLPAESTEFGVSLSHTTHGKVACASCHSLTTATVQLRPPRGHTACTTSGCHTKSGPAPQLAACESCHELGLRDRRDATRRGALWSVRARFDHAPHERTLASGTRADAKPVACITCHVDLSAAKVIDLAAPAKATCAPCHDGTAAFKLTGTTCTKCHPGPTK